MRVIMQGIVQVIIQFINPLSMQDIMHAIMQVFGHSVWKPSNN